MKLKNNDPARLIVEKLLAYNTIELNNFRKILYESIYTGKYEVTKLLLQQKPELKKASDHLASKLLANDRGDLELLKILLPPSIPLTAEKFHEKTLLQLAVLNNHFSAVSYFFARKESLSKYSDKELGEILLILVSKNLINRAKILIKLRPDLRKDICFPTDGNFALHFCMGMKCPDADLVMMLYKNNSCEASRNNEGKFPLLIAAEKGHFALVDRIIQDKNIVKHHSIEKLLQIVEVLVKYNKFQLTQLLLKQQPDLQKNTSFIQLTTKIRGKQMLSPQFSFEEFSISINTIEANNINLDNLIFFLRRYLYLFYIKSFSASIFAPHPVLKLLDKLMQKETITMTRAELGIAVDSSDPRQNLLKQIVDKFSSVEQLEELRDDMIVIDPRILDIPLD